MCSVGMLQSVFERVTRPLKTHSYEKCTGSQCEICEKNQLKLFDREVHREEKKTSQELGDDPRTLPWAKYLDPEAFPQGYRSVDQGPEEGRMNVKAHKKSYEQADLVVCDASEATPKSDVVSMEHPLFALKAGERRERVYSNKNVTVRVRPGLSGLATIFDKDVWLFCIGQLRHARNNGTAQTGRTVHFKVSDFLKATSRRVDGQAYKEFIKALERLSETRIITNIEADGYNERQGFGLVEGWRAREDKNRRMIGITVTLPECLLQAVESTNVLTYNRQYFSLRRPLERRLYEIARKHCGSQARWSVSLSLLHSKSGSVDNIRKFRTAIKALAKKNGIPDYSLSFDVAEDRVAFAYVLEGTKARSNIEPRPNPSL